MILYVAHAALDLGAAPVASISERVGAPLGLALVLARFLDPLRLTMIEWYFY
jgi:hypothetical protein